jgi:hypothetical protein
MNMCVNCELMSLLIWSYIDVAYEIMSMITTVYC